MRRGPPEPAVPERSSGLYDATTGRFWAAMLQYENARLECPWTARSSPSTTSQSARPTIPVEPGTSTNSTCPLPPGLLPTTRRSASTGTRFSSRRTCSATQAASMPRSSRRTKPGWRRGRAGFTADGFFNILGNGPGITAKTGPFLTTHLQPVQNLDKGGTHDPLRRHRRRSRPAQRAPLPERCRCLPGLDPLADEASDRA